MKPHYERFTDEDRQQFPGGGYKVAGWGAGVAWAVLGWETEPDEDTEWSGYETRTGKIIAVMIGDDRYFSLDPEDVEPIPRESYCGECGQIGCTCDALDRENA
jgi:hypothetical protein